MQIKVRVRTNDVNAERKANQLVHDGFILYDNCTEVKYGEPVTVSLEEFKNYTFQHENIREARKHTPYNLHPETGENIANLIYMVRDIDATEKRLVNDPEYKDKPRFNNMADVHRSFISSGDYCLSPYHFNTIEWVDRMSNKRYRLLFDTLCFITDDQGNTLRKVQG